MVSRSSDLIRSSISAELDPEIKRLSKFRLKVVLYGSYLYFVQCTYSYICRIIIILNYIESEKIYNIAYLYNLTFIT